MNKYTYLKLLKEERARRNARRIERYQRQEAVEASVGSKEALPDAVGPEFDEEETRPLTPQGRSLAALRKRA